MILFSLATDKLLMSSRIFTELAIVESTIRLFFSTLSWSSSIVSIYFVCESLISVICILNFSVSSILFSMLL